MNSSVYFRKKRSQIRLIAFLIFIFFTYTSIPFAFGQTRKVETATLLGMELSDPTPELMEEFGLSPLYPGPIILSVKNSSYFPSGAVPPRGSSFWIVESPARGFRGRLENVSTTQRSQPRYLKEFAKAVLSSVATPLQYLNWDKEIRKQFRERAEKIKDDQLERNKLLAIADKPIDPSKKDKYVVRVVYNFPERSGTMTTEILLEKKDLDELKMYLGESSEK